MSRSCTLKLRNVLQTALACCLLVPISSQIAWADPPGGVQRTFAVEFIGPQLDFQARESLCLVVAPADPLAAPSFLRFADENLDPRFDSTIWEHRLAMHVKIGGAEIPGFVTWLVTPETPTGPPTGALTFTGPDSPLILDQELVYIKSCNPATCGPGSAGKVHVGTATDNDGKMVVVTAIFSR